MKKNVFIVSLIVLTAIIAICIVIMRVNSKTSKLVLKQNAQYEQYLEDNIYGTDVITLINKAITDNETNKVYKYKTTTDNYGYNTNNKATYPFNLFKEIFE